MCTIDRAALPDTHFSPSQKKKLMAAVLFKHAKANNHSFDSTYSMALTLPYFTDTDACIGGEGPFFSAYVEDAVGAKGTKH